MKGFFKKLRTFFIVGVLSVSLTVSNTAAVTYQAAAIPVVYSAWEVFVVILSLVGITLCAAEDHAEAQLESADELARAFEGWRVLKGDGLGDNNGDGQDDRIGTFNPLDYLQGDQLTIPEEDLELWQEFARAQGWKPAYEPVDSVVNLYGATLGEYQKFLANYFGISSSDSTLAKFVNGTYNSFVSNDYSCFFESYWSTSYIKNFNYYIFDSSYGYCFGEYSKTNSSNILYYISGLRKQLESSYLLQFKNSDSPTAASNDSSGRIYDGRDVLFIAKGQVYDFYDIFYTTENITSGIDYGNVVYLDDFGVPDNHFGESIKDTMNQIGDTSLVPYVESGTLDVIGGGRTWDEDEQQASGDISITMPAPETITDFSNGTLTYEDMMDELGTTPVDEATGTNLLTQEFLSIQTGIFSGVSSIVDVLQNIWAWLNNLLDSIVQAFIDMLVGLFVPRDGFIDGKIGQIQSKLDTLGVVPYDMSVIFDSDDENPFKNITINIYGQEVVIVSFDYLPAFLNRFRPVIRGLLVLFLLYYSINQLLALIRLSGMMEGGNTNQLAIQGSTVPKIEDKGGRV